jgi:hypothetical protein
MSEVNLKEINDYISNLYDRVNLEEIDASHSARVRTWMLENMSNVGRYSHRDFERFGVFQSLQFSDDTQQKRQDGWQSLTEEVPDIDHITYGTGVLYIHGEMEVPPWENTPGDHIVGDEFGHRSGEDHHFEVAASAQKQEFAETQDGSDVIQGYKWNFSSGTPSEDYRWEDITNSVASPTWGEMDPSTQPSVTATTPAVFNDGEIYNLDNERNHYPWVIINSGQTASVNTLLQSLNETNGMYDETLPAIASATGTYPPVVAGEFVTISDDGREAILDYISPLNETPR